LGFAKNSFGGQTKRLLDDLMVFGFALGASGRKNFMADADVRQSGFAVLDINCGSGALETYVGHSAGNFNKLFM
jgi:hypothetical protein